ncbi:unnamed protein product [Chilo suppressalis]|uniref:Uncharacterized protein n=1 Tax=Chilo suppressalis TaxID=168631 RepID=A0ABN8EAL5_CHISP|nr:unnamed protein product [Chilo suppressalis]
MKLLAFVLALLAMALAVVSGMATGGASAGIREGKEKAPCWGNGAPQPPPTNSTG